VDVDRQSRQNARRAARRKETHKRMRAQWREARELRMEILRLLQTAKRDNGGALRVLKKRCDASRAFRRVYSTIMAERKGSVRRVAPESFTPGSSRLQGGRVNPR
jgi:hypothetical protein